jgi:hypothetical protein
VLRLLNPTDHPIDARVRLGFPVSTVIPVRLDETASDAPCVLEGNELRLEVPAKALRSVHLRA